MLSSSVDQKLKVLYDRYQDRDFAANATKEVEQIRRKALYTGALISGVAFVGNEATRLTMRSRTNHFSLTHLGSCF